MLLRTTASWLASIALLFPLLDAGAVPSQRSSDRALRRVETVNEWPSSSKRWALVIGVDKYQDRQISPLVGATNDAKALAEALVENAGFARDQVILLASDQPPERQPSRVNVLRRLSNLASVVPKDGLLLVSFAGHGIERNGQAFLLPSDAQLSDDVMFLEETALSVERIKTWVRTMGVKQVVVLLDACRNDPSGRADAPNPLTKAFASGFNFDVQNREVTAFATLYATAIGQRAFEYTEKQQGYFTWALIEGLKGAAANERGEVTLARLVSYVQQTVPRRISIDLGAGKEQKPFAVIEGYKAEDLIIAMAPVSSPVAATGSATSIDASTAEEVRLWTQIRDSRKPDDFKSYLTRYPNGLFAPVARLKVQPAAATAEEFENVRIETAATPALRARPVGSQVAQKQTDGVLFILTNAPAAEVTIKSGGAQLRKGPSQNGEFRAELPPGTYEVEVGAPRFLPYQGRASVQVARAEIIRAELTPTTGKILVGPVETDAQVLLNGRKPAKLTVNKAENQIEIDEVPVGLHSLKVEHPAILPWERTRIEVLGGARTYISPKFKVAMVNLEVRSEPGAEIYVDGTYRGKVAEDGKTGVLEIPPGERVIKAVKPEFMPAEATRRFTPGNSVVEMKLDRMSFSPEFADYFMEGAKFWDAPAGWQVSSGRLTVRGTGVGLVREKIYKDLRVELDVKFGNGKGAAWIVRAQDERNYYIFQLIGPRGSTPNRFRSYISENGRLKLLKTDFVPEDIGKPDDSFHIIIEAKGPVIRHWIQVKSAPKSEGPQPLSTLSDSSFSYGKVGFGTVDAEESVVLFFNVIPL